MKRLEGKVCLITGASMGIGEGIARRFAQEGAKVIVTARNLGKVNKVVEDIRAAGGEATGVSCDVSKRDQIQAAVETAVKTYGRLDVMVNNAGFNKPMKFLDVTDDNFREIMDTNALGCLAGIQEAAKVMIKQGDGGKIINCTSMAGRQGFPDFTPYSASKWAIIAITQAAARELTPQYGICVNAYGPGVVATPLWEQLDKDLAGIGSFDKEGEAFDGFASGILRGRAAVPEDIAGTVLFLASADGDYLTGQVVMCDGGMTLV